MTALDFAATFGLGIAILIGVASFVHALQRQPVSIGPLSGAIAAVCLYGASIVYLPDLIAWPAWFDQLSWNWTGKAISIVSMLLFLLAYPGLALAECGLTTRQSTGSLGPACLAAAILCASAILLQTYVNDGSDRRLETILFEATLPGIDEELAFRGVLAALLVRTFATRINVLGAPAGWGDVALILLFAAGHGLLFVQQQIHFDPFSFAYTGFVGAGLLWIRHRTGSLLIPVAAHNLVNILLVTL